MPVHPRLVYVAEMTKSFVCLGHIYGMHGIVEAHGQWFEYLKVESAPPLIQGNTLSESITDSQFGSNKLHTVYHDHKFK